jgi:microcystin-dependent protein
MANYTKSTNFTAKDSLPTGDSARIVKGTEIDTEFTAISAAIASKADSNSPTFTGTPAAPTATAGTNTTQLATTAFATAAALAAFPAGGIIMWSGSIAAIPAGWALCNGTSGTPDLRDRFVIGAGTLYAVNATGGSATSVSAGTVGGTTGATSLTEAQMPKHYHKLWGPAAISGFVQGPVNNAGLFNGGTPDDTAQTYGSYSVGGDAGSGGFGTGTSVGNGHTHPAGSLTFSGSAHNNLPPYLALAYIMKL